MGVTSRTQPTPQASEVGSVGSAAALVATSSRWEDVGGPTADHVNVGAVVTLMLEFPGVNRVGLGRVPRVAKLCMLPSTVVVPLLASSR
jgi:hypothetical protein